MTLPRWVPRLQAALICLNMFMLGANAIQPFLPFWLTFIIAIGTGSMMPYVWERLA